MFLIKQTTHQNIKKLRSYKRIDNLMLTFYNLKTFHTSICFICSTHLVIIKCNLLKNL